MRAGFSSQRIVVVGTSGSGKTTLAREVSQRSQLHHIELDALYWEPSWGEPPKDVFRQRVSDALGRASEKSGIGSNVIPAPRFHG